MPVLIIKCHDWGLFQAIATKSNALLITGGPSSKSNNWDVIRRGGTGISFDGRGSILLFPPSSPLESAINREVDKTWMYAP